MDKFDKLFQDKLGEITENDFEFKNTSWERFEGKWQDENAVSNQLVFFTWAKRNVAVAAIMLLLLSSNMFFAKQFLNTRSDVKALSKTIETLNDKIFTCENGSKSENSLLQFTPKSRGKLGESEDVVSDINTIVNSNSALVASLENQNLALAKALEFYKKTVENGELSNTSNQLTGNIPPVPNDKMNEPANVTQGQLTNEIVNTIDNSTVEILNYNFLNKKLLFLKNTFEEDTLAEAPEIPVYTEHQKTELGTKIVLAAEALKPTHYQIGVKGQISGIATAKDVHPIIVSSIGASGSALFFNKLRLTGGVNFLEQTINWQDIHNLDDGVIQPILNAYPKSTPNNWNDKLLRMEGSIQGFDLPLSAEFLLRPNAKWNPYFGLGIVGRYYKSYKFEYYWDDYGHTAESYETKKLGNINAFGFNSWQSNIGLEYRFSKNWLINTELIYIQSYKNQVFGLSNIQQFGVNLGVQYAF